MAKSSLPQKREGDDKVLTPKEAKAQKKMEAIAKAREWANKRKSVEDGGSGDTPKKARAEAEDVITNLPNIPAAKKSRKSSGDSVASADSIGSRTRSRRRSMGTTAATTAPAAAKKRSASPKKSPRKTPAKSKKKAAVEQVVVEEKQPEVTSKEEEKAAAEPAETEAAQTNEDAAGTPKKTSFLPHFAVFLHSVVIQWSIAFAIIMTFCLDWWLFQFGTTVDGVSPTERASCAILGIWLITVSANSIVFGTFSRVGWILTTSSFAMLSFAVKMLKDDVSSASLPVYQVNGNAVNVPDLLLSISLLAFIFVMKQPESPVESGVAAESSSDQNAPEAESKEVMEAVMIASKEATGPRSLIGQRVCVEEKGVPLFGTVAGYDDKTRFWTVLFDDQDQEEGELNRVELASAFKSYSKHLADSLKAMWKAGEI